jgi:hypothetical protein
MNRNTRLVRQRSLSSGENEQIELALTEATVQLRIRQLGTKLVEPALRSHRIPERGSRFRGSQTHLPAPSRQPPPRRPAERSVVSTEGRQLRGTGGEVPARLACAEASQDRRADARRRPHGLGFDRRASPRGAANCCTSTAASSPTVTPSTWKTLDTGTSTTPTAPTKHSAARRREPHTDRPRHPHSN